MKGEYRTVESFDTDGNKVKVFVKKPDTKDYQDSQVVYNQEFRKAIESGAMLKQKLLDYLEKEGIWDKDKQAKNDKFVKDIRDREDTLKAGGIKLSEAKKIALELRGLRAQFQMFLAEKNQQDGNSVEGQAENARFSELVRLCIYNEKEQRYFVDTADYEKNMTQPFVLEASSELANMLYGLDPNYEKNLEENKFLKEFEFVNEDLRLVNDDGHLVDVGGKLINEDGRYVAYRTKEAEKSQDKDQQYFVNVDGKEVVCIKGEDGEEDWVRKDLAERKPFLDDSGKPVESKKEDYDKKTAAKRKKRTPKTEAETT